MNNKLVSIIIPVYNSQENLNRCISSCINQTYKNIEIMCINDGSKDESLNILKKYAKNDTRIKVIDQENMGVSVARNNGLKMCKGDYITFLDSDDFLNNDSIEIMVKIIEQEKVDIIRTNYLRVLEDGSSHVNFNPFIKNKLYNKEDIVSKVLNKILSGEMSSHLWLLCINSKLIKNNKIEFIPGIKVMQDKLFYLKLFSKASSFYQAENVTYNYFCNSSSTIMSSKKSIMRIEFIVKVAELCEEILIKEGLINQVEINNLYRSHFISLCREIYFCKSSFEAIEKIKQESCILEYQKIIKNTQYKKLRFDNKIVLFLLKHKHYKLLYYFSSLIIKLKKKK